MIKNFHETIFAQSTPIGYGGIGIIRISGKKSKNIAKKILGIKLTSRKAKYTSFKNKKGKIIDFGIAIYYKSPNSFTGEDILELQCHGGQKIIELILKSIIDLKIKNTRIAEAGEFTERAFLNKKIDLIQAETINNLINANSEKIIFSAIKSLKGEFSKKINNIINLINNLIFKIEKKISFSEKKINFNKIKKIKKKNYLIYKKIKKIYKKSKKSKLINNKIKIAIIGKPNVGKSSLMNILTKKKISIVTNIPGTTRDIIKKNININNNYNIEINDTTGIHKTNNKIEKIGIKKTWKLINKSNIILFLENAFNITEKKIYNLYKKKIKNKIKKKKKILYLIRNKIDISKEKYKIIKKKKYTIMNISIKKKYGTKEISSEINKKIKNLNKENFFLVQQRHLHLIKKTFKEIKNINKIIKINLNKKNINLDIIYQNLFNSQKFLNEILGKNKFTSKNIINKIFKNFCIGK